MPRTKNDESSRSVTKEVATPEVAPQVPDQEHLETPKPKPEGGPKRYQSPSGLTIEDF